jgi:2-dehydropantoate 2-reductase
VLTDPANTTEPIDVGLLAVKDTQNEQAGPRLARLCGARATPVVAHEDVGEAAHQKGKP